MSDQVGRARVAQGFDFELKLDAFELPMGDFFLQPRGRVEHGADRFGIVGAGKFGHPRGELGAIT